MKDRTRWRVYFRDADARGPGTLELVADAYALERRAAIREARAILLAHHPGRTLRLTRVDPITRPPVIARA